MEEEISDYETPIDEIIILPKPKSNENNNLDETASDHEQYLQDCFQDELVDDIFNDIEDYIRDQAIPICEYLTRDSVEEIIDLFLL